MLCCIPRSRYWLQDEVIPHGFLLFGVDFISGSGWGSGSGATVAGNDAQAALALAGIVGSVASTATSVVGGLGPCDRSRRLVIGGSTLLMGLGAACLAFTHSFTLFLALSAANGLLTGLAAAPTTAVTADVLPSEEDDASTAANPARDANLFTLAGTIPATVLPLPFGNLLPGAGQPGRRRAVYNTFFWVQAGLSVGAIWMLQGVDPWKERGFLTAPSSERQKDSGGAESLQQQGSNKAPSGAAMCDRMLFSRRSTSPSDATSRE